MIPTASADVQACSGAGDGVAARWIVSRTFDAVFLIFVPVTTLPIALAPFVAGSPAGIGLSALAFLLATAHYLSTFAFYAWKQNRAYHRERWRLFFGGPAAIALALVVLASLRLDAIVVVTVFLWNTLHVARQSCGLVSLYRHRAGIDDPSQKVAANSAIVATSFGMALWNLGTFAEIKPLIRLDSTDIVVLRVGAGLVACTAVLGLVRALLVRARSGRSARGPELAMLAVGLLMFHPFLWFPDTMSATFAMLAPHYVQYLALLWLVQRRKFAGASRVGGEALLRWVSTRSLHLCFALLIVSVPFLAARAWMTHAGLAYEFSALYTLLALVHFYLDGLFWAFRQPHVRRMLGPYLAPLPARGEALVVRS